MEVPQSFRVWAKRCLAVLWTAAMLALTLPVGAQEQHVFNIPAQPLSDALTAFGRQSGLQITYQPELAAGLSSRAVSGSYTPEQALQQLLTGTGVAYRFTNDRTVTLERILSQPGDARLQLEPTTVEEQAIKVEETQVVAERERAHGYVAREATTATKTDTPLIETPQSVTVITPDVMKDRAARTVGQALETVAGVTRRESFYFSDEFLLRGFFVDNTSGLYLDGRRALNRILYDTTMLERIEVFKGPASVLYGALEPGGLVNMATKRPTDAFFATLDQEFGSWDDYKTALDLSLPLGAFGLRLPVAYRYYDSFRDFVEDNYNLQTAPSLSWALSPQTKFTLLGFFTKQKRVDDNVKIPVLNGEPVNVPRSRFLGQPGEHHRVQLGSGALELAHVFSDQLTLRSAINFYDADEFQNTVVSVFGLLPDGRTLTRFRGAGPITYTTYGTQHDLRWSPMLWGMPHQLLTGVEVLSREEKIRVGFSFLADIDVYQPIYDDTLTFIGTSKRDTDETLIGGFVQDQVTLIENRPGIHKLQLLVGARYDSAKQKVFDQSPFTGAITKATATKSAWSPRVGLLWMPISTLSLYGSFSKSFVPQVAQTLSEALADPQKGTQYEVGAKVELPPSLFATVSLFNLTKTNVPTANPLGPAFPSLLSGKERSRGVEVEVGGEIVPNWQMVSSYTYLDTEVLESNNGNKGKRTFGAPRHSLALWTSYTSMSGIGGGVGVNYVSDFYGDNFENLKVNGRTLVDTALWYRPPSSGRLTWSIGLNIRNLFDEEYYLTGNGFGTSVEPGAPRSVIGSLRVEF